MIESDAGAAGESRHAQSGAVRPPAHPRRTAAGSTPVTAPAAARGHRPAADRHESDVLLRQLDGHLASLQLTREHIDVGLAEQVAAALRRLVTETASASAADRARVRAAVHFFMLRRGARRFRRPVRGLADHIEVVNELLSALGRDDLAIHDSRTVSA